MDSMLRARPTLRSSWRTKFGFPPAAAANMGETRCGLSGSIPFGSMTYAEPLCESTLSGWDAHPASSSAATTAAKTAHFSCLMTLTQSTANLAAKPNQKLDMALFSRILHERPLTLIRTCCHRADVTRARTPGPSDSLLLINTTHTMGYTLRLFWREICSVTYVINSHTLLLTLKN